MKTIALVVMTVMAMNVYGQNKTDISLMRKGSGTQSSEVASETGDLYSQMEHHGPAVENEWIGLRLYFDHKGSIDVYNKEKPGLELAAAGWYPTVEQQNEGWGADYYKVGSTVGLGGIRLWDGQKVLSLTPVTMRTARVRKEANQSYMEMLSEGIPYCGDTIDVLVRVTVFSGMREAKVEAFAFSSHPVQFYTGVNYHKGMQTKQGDDYICTWGIHPEDVAASQLNIGAGIIFNPADFASIAKGPKQYEMVSKPTKYLETWITSSCEREAELNSMEALVKYLEDYSK
ncbi:DUF4861 family protein [Geofilum sp. OHC36d9]|uniref:DUF4861 family protein n=1 Tax=Geofilum sp. OHC36d9 TaxID=3458413 RepID=UPI004033DCFD